MHPYSTDTHKRSQVTTALVLISIIAAIIINTLVLNSSVDIGGWGWLVSPPTVIGVYGLLWVLFDTWLWKRINRIIPGVLDVPDLNGTWSGNLKSSYDNFQSEHPVTVEIRQSWSNISIMLRTANSNSRSLTASILTRTSGACMLSYDYLNEPRGHAQDSMNMHRGTGYFDLVEPNKLEGQYYNSRGRKNHGEICLERKV
jgi:hypothetical protein